MQDLLPDCRDCIDSIWIKLKRDYRPITNGLYTKYCSREQQCISVFPFLVTLYFHILYSSHKSDLFKLDSSSRFFRKMRNKIFHDIMHTCK